MIVTTSKFKMNTEMYLNLLKLFQEYCTCDNVSVDEFVEAKVLCEEPLSEEEIEKFVLLIAHKNFLSAIKDDIVAHYNLRNFNEIRLIMVIFFTIFTSEQATVENLYSVFKDMKCAFKRKVLEYFCEENNLIHVALTGCKFLDDDYILKTVINPLLNKTSKLKRVSECLGEDKTQKFKPKPPTVPDTLNVLLHKKRIPAVPLNTPAEFPFFQAQNVPRSVYLANDDINRKLISEHEKNKLRAKQLLAKAKSLSKNYLKPKKPVVVREEIHYLFKAQKVPTFKQNIKIKENVATVLREANLCIKEQEKEIRNIEVLLKGDLTLEKFKEMEENARQLEQQKFLEDIERKHLEGLLTFEEAILAKKKLIECNKERFKQFMEEREAFLKKIEQWKQEEQKKIKSLVKKGQEIERNARESEKKLKENKRKQADLLKEKTKKRLQEALSKQRQELAKKVKLIEEIKSLHQLRRLQQVKEFDPSEGSNLGLLCQMSIADLQEKLTEMKFKMQQELEQKRKCIKMYKERQKHMIENVKNFVAQARMSKPKPKVLPIGPSKLARSPGLVKLREQLKIVRDMRMNSVAQATSNT